ncbi:XkdQ/YqbQ family protein [Desulforamulus aquiferis]|uniref:YqbQ/XkdQ domain-containing protein n=1 Tax=Desulforamulus aquiferis TaxID=1397668 RepID=A0AAW7ZCZ1_9FIRM|nr:hypothetical protein [Desulforamulus aquiferis]MDO7787120.1 hypothetical protein [Desulforamulus aquiferis]
MSIQVLVVRQDGSLYELPVESVSWSGAKTKAPRQIDVTMVATSRGGHNFIEPHEGNGVIFLWKGQELFRGIEFKRNRNKSGIMGFTSYDNAIYLVKNTESYVFVAKKASDITKRICSDFQIAIGTIVDTGYVIPSRVYPGKSLYEIIMDALYLTYKQTGKRFYLYSKDGKLHLINRAESPRKWVIEDGVNLVDYEYESSIEDTFTRVKLEAGEEKKTIIATAKNDELDRQFGILQYYEKVSDKVNKGQLQERANQILKNKGKVNKTFSLDNVLGIPDCISGQAIHVISQDLGIKNGYYIEEDTHTFVGNEHIMILKLQETNDIEEINAGEEG